MNLELKNITISVDDSVFMNKLKTYCWENGFNYFHTINILDNEIMTNCPFHSLGQERRPSFGISTNKGVYHCFTCGCSGTIPELISNIFGYNDLGLFGERWLLRTFNSSSWESRGVFDIYERNVNTTSSTGFTEEELKKYRYYHPYMYERGLNNEIIEKFDVGYDKNSNCVTFPVFNVDGTPAFIARRSVYGKFFHYPSGSNKPVYCAERFVTHSYEFAVIVESIFNCLTCWRYGLPSMALLGTGTRYQYSILCKLPVRRYILALDPDPAGNRGREKLKQYLGKYKMVTEFILPKGKDINDLDDKVLLLKESFGF